MTVGELIEYLKQQPEDVEVLSYRDGLMNRAPEVLTAVDWDDYDTQDSVRVYERHLIGKVVIL